MLAGVMTAAVIRDRQQRLTRSSTRCCFGHRRFLARGATSRW
jgi:hypothetical protein